MEQLTAIRLDKWLWTARFFKTRSLASEAVKGGKVSVNGQRAKPSRSVQSGDRLSVRRGQFEYLIEVTGIAKGRVAPAATAQLYQESAESIERRTLLALTLKAQGQSQPRSIGRPSKRDRRKLLSFTGKQR